VYGAAAARWLGVPHVITMHGNQTTTNRWRRRATLGLAIRYSDAVIAVSGDTKRYYDAQLGLDAHPLRVVPNGVPRLDGDRSVVRRELGLTSTDQLVVATGSLVPRKGHAVLVKALAAQTNGSCWHLAIAGNGPERAALDDLVRSLDLESRVHLLGHRDDIGNILAASDIFAMPSLWEGLPLSLLEAMSCGKPVVASATSGIPEAVDTEQDGLLVAPGNVEELTAALARLLSDAALRQRLGERAAARARAVFSIDAMTGQYEDTYRALAQRSGPAARR